MHAILRAASVVLPYAPAMHCIGAEWPGFHFPGAGALLSALLAAVIAALALRRRKESLAWIGVAALATLVALSEAFNLEFLAGAVGRCALLHGSLYGDRRGLQAAIMGALALTIPLLALGFVRRRPELARRLGVAPWAAAALFLYIGWRALSLHMFDHLIYVRLFGLTVNRIVELALLLLLLYVVAKAPTPDPS